MTAQQQDRLDAEEVGDAVFGPVHVPGDGPHDIEDLDPEVTLGAGTVDFGAVRVPVPERGTVAVDPSEKGRMQAVHVSVPEGRLSVSALAAPKSSRLWPDLVKEIDASLREGGARVRSFQGDWGRELHATSGAATSLFVGVDGARWMLYGVATGPTRDADVLDEQLRRMMRGTIVVRGRSPYPVRTVLPLEVPEQLATSAAAAPEVGGTVVELRPPADAGYRSAPTAAYPAGAAPAPPPVDPPTTALPVVAPPVVAPPPTALPVAGWAADRAPGWSPAAAADTAPPQLSPPTTALPVHRGPANGYRPGDVTPPTTALPVAPPRGRGPVAGPTLWSDPVHRIADPGGPQSLDAGLDPDDRPTDIRPVPGPSGAGMPGGSETAPWALDPPPPPGPGGRRHLREPGEHLPVSPGLTGPWAPWPDSPTGSGRALAPAGPAAVPPAATGRRRAEETGPPWRGALPVEPSPPSGPTSGPRRPQPAEHGRGADARPGRRPLADTGPADVRPVRARPDAGPPPPRTDRPRVPAPAPTEALLVVPDVLRVGRHAVVESRPDPTGRGRETRAAETRAGRGAETQPWVAARASRPATGPGQVVETAPWASVDRAAASRPAASRPESGLVTEPLPLPPPAAERPTGRHHRPD